MQTELASCAWICVAWSRSRFGALACRVRSSSESLTKMILDTVSLSMNVLQAVHVAEKIHGVFTKRTYLSAEVGDRNGDNTVRSDKTAAGEERN